jgi:hypothetical protein
MARRKLKKIELIIIVGFVASALTLLAFWWLNKKGNRDFYLPRDYAGWVMVCYEVPDAPPLPVKDEVQQLIIPANGILETSSKLEIGWRRDRYFWQEDDGTLSPVPPVVDQKEGPHIYIHQHQFFSRSYMGLAKQMDGGTDTTLTDGTAIERMGSGLVNYEPGRKSLEHFYLSATPKPLQFQPPENLRSQALESLNSRELKLDD